MTQKLDDQIVRENEKIKEENQLLILENNNLITDNYQLAQQNDKLVVLKESAQEQLNSINGSISAMEKQAQEAADIFYQTKMQAAEENFNHSLENFKHSLEIESQKYREKLNDFQRQCDKEIEILTKQRNDYAENIARIKAINDSAIEAAKRAEEIKNQQDFYRIKLSETDIHEIELLREVEPHLRNKEPLNKIIWKCYYEKPTTDLIGRVVGLGVHTGIYKLTEISTGKCYVGQSTNIADRWKQHIKRGVGADTPTRNKLYPAMIAVGPENFTFEVVEECDKSMLDEKEKYWTDYFKAQEFGFSIRKG